MYLGRETFIKVKLKQSEKQSFEQSAASCNQNVSEYVRQLHFRLLTAANEKEMSVFDLLGKLDHTHNSTDDDRLQILDNLTELLKERADKLLDLESYLYTAINKVDLIESTERTDEIEKIIMTMLEESNLYLHEISEKLNQDPEFLFKILSKMRIENKLQIIDMKWSRKGI